jgi:predicted PurR-regulated permease PerM
VAIVKLVGWLINMNILAPLVRSDSLQVHPIVVTLAFLLGAQLSVPVSVPAEALT